MKGHEALSKNYQQPLDKALKSLNKYVPKLKKAKASQRLFEKVNKAVDKYDEDFKLSDFWFRADFEKQEDDFKELFEAAL